MVQQDLRSGEVARILFAAFAGTIIAGCGSRGASAAAAAASSAGAPAASSTTCSIELSGAQTGTLACSDDLTAMYGIKEKTTLVGFSSSGSAPGVMIGIKFPGVPTTTTYRSSDAGATQGIWARSGTTTWLAQGSTADHGVGSYVLTLTSVKEVPLASDTKGYDVHGTITATLQPDPDTGATGTITLKARF